MIKILFSYLISCDDHYERECFVEQKMKNILLPLQNFILLNQEKKFNTIITTTTNNNNNISNLKITK